MRTGERALAKIETLRLDLIGLHEYQQNRHPYLLVDAADEVVPGVRAKGHKDLTENDWFFPVHFPGNPMMPAMLQMEAMVQLGALTVLTLPGNKGKVVYLASANNLKFSRKVVPGHRFEIEAKLLSWKRGVGTCSGTGSVQGEIACRADFTIVLPDVLDQYRVIG